MDSLPKDIFNYHAFISSITEIHVVHPLSAKLQELLGGHTDLLERMKKFVLCSKLLYQGPSDDNIVLETDSGIAIKFLGLHRDLTEYTTLQYLRDHAPAVPIPEPHGVIKTDMYYLLFQSRLPGSTLQSVWPSLCTLQKVDIQQKLNDILLKLRSLPHNPSVPLGGPLGEGCKDSRRTIRKPKNHLYSSKEFEEFQYSCPIWGSELFTSFIKQFLHCDLAEPKIVFTHGDFRPANIIVNTSPEGDVEISGIVDWFTAGFYPDYYEATKVTSTLSPADLNDWYLFLPECASPQKYPQRWLLDRVWDRNVRW